MSIRESGWRGALSFLSDREGGPEKRRRKRPGLEVMGLERRELMTIVRTQITINAVPSILPNTGRAVPVHVVGQVASTLDYVQDGFFQVTDQYRAVEPRGPVALTPLGARDGLYWFSFDFEITLQAQARSNTPSGGRQYFILVGATDKDNTEGQTITAFVPASRPPARLPFMGPRFRFGPRARP